MPFPNERFWSALSYFPELSQTQLTSHKSNLNDNNKNKTHNQKEAPGNVTIIEEVSQSWSEGPGSVFAPGLFELRCFGPGCFAPWHFGPGRLTPLTFWTRTFRPLTFWTRKFRPPDFLDLDVLRPGRFALGLFEPGRFASGRFGPGRFDPWHFYLFVLFVLKFYGTVNNEVMSSQLVNCGTVPGQA